MRAISIVAAFIAGTFFASFVAFAWTEPSGPPPSGNVRAPINVGSTDQTKNGVLGVNGLAVFGNTLLAGSSRYLNWGTTVGSAGYGIRDSSGTLQFKNTGGSWESLQTIVNNYITLGGGSGWTASGNDIYNANSGNVGIGTTNPTAKLHVGGTAGVDGLRFPDGTLQTTAAGSAAGQWCGLAVVKSRTSCQSTSGGGVALPTSQYATRIPCNGQNLSVLCTGVHYVDFTDSGGSEIPMAGAVQCPTGYTGVVMPGAYPYYTNSATPSTGVTASCVKQ